MNRAWIGWFGGGSKGEPAKVEAGTMVNSSLCSHWHHCGQYSSGPLGGSTHHFLGATAKNRQTKARAVEIKRSLSCLCVREATKRGRRRTEKLKDHNNNIRGPKESMLFVVPQTAACLLVPSKSNHHQRAPLYKQQPRPLSGCEELELTSKGGEQPTNTRSWRREQMKAQTVKNKVPL